MADDLTFVIHPETESASIGLFIKSLERINRLLRDVDHAIYRSKGERRWVISSLHASSPTVTLRSVLGDSEAVDALADGLRSVTIGTDQPPRYFTEQALQDLHKMKGLFRGKDRAKSIVVSVGSRQAATIRQDIGEKAGRILAAGYHNIGSLQGTLEAINVHGALTVTIWDRVSRAPVRCNIPRSDKWVSSVKDLLEKRVIVTGTIHYFVNGVPRSISNVVEIADATPDPSLPKAEFGSIPDSEAARAPAEFLRSVRRFGPE